MPAVDIFQWFSKLLPFRLIPLLTKYLFVKLKVKLCFKCLAHNAKLPSITAGNM